METRETIMAKPILHRHTEILRTPSKNDIIPSILLLLAGRGAVLGVFPFGTAFFAACCDKSSAYLSITVMYLALLSAGAGDMAVKYMMSALIFWLFINLYTRKSRTIEALVCGSSVFISGLSSMFYTFGGMYDIFILFLESTMSGVMYIIFSNSKNVAVRYKSPYAVTQEELLSISAAAGVFILGMGRMELPYGISIANIITIYTILISALNSPISSAALTGLILGFITGGQNAVIMTGAMGLSALFGGFLKSMGRFGAAAGFVGGSCAVLLYAVNGVSIPYGVWDVLIGAGLFAATPSFVQRRYSLFFGGNIKMEQIKDSDRLKSYISDKLHKYASSFLKLESNMSFASEQLNNNPITLRENIFTETAGRVCGSCPRRSKCWEKDYDKTIACLNDLYSSIEKKGIISINSMPLSLREKCIKPEYLLLEFGHIYELFKIKETAIGEQKSIREMTAMQYKETSSLFNQIASDLELDFRFCSELEEETVRIFEKNDIIVYEISITEGQRTEIYIRLNKNCEISFAEKLLSDIIGISIGFDHEGDSGLYFVSRPRFSIDAGIKQISKENSCGDTIRMFGTDEYKLYCIICDGMGTGDTAAAGSSMAAELLQNFLQAGFSIKTAVSMVNSSMYMSADPDYFITLDLFCIDLMSGVSEFYKIGAAPSLMYHKGKTETIFAAAFPIGMSPKTEILPQTKRLEDGDIILIASDGVTEAGEVKTDWLKVQIKSCCQSMQTMAEETAAKALERAGGQIQDDMSVIAIKVMEN